MSFNLWVQYFWVVPLTFHPECLTRKRKCTSCTHNGNSRILRFEIPSSFLKGHPLWCHTAEAVKLATKIIIYTYISYIYMYIYKGLKMLHVTTERRNKPRLHYIRYLVSFVRNVHNSIYSVWPRIKYTNSNFNRLSASCLLLDCCLSLATNQLSNCISCITLMTNAENRWDFDLTTNTPYFAHRGELWCVCSDNFELKCWLVSVE